MKRRPFYLALLILSLSLAACGSLIPGQTASPPEQPQATETLPMPTTTPTTPQSPTETAPETAVPAASATPEITSPPQITNRTWKWLRTQMNDGSVVTPLQADAFTILLGEDGSVQGTTDCNSFSGSYALEADTLLSFEPFATTKMFCEASQEAEFLRSLGEVQSFLFFENQLVLEIKYDSGQMIFEDAGSPAGY